jgi:hypothetical protein
MSVEAFGYKVSGDGADPPHARIAVWTMRRRPDAGLVHAWQSAIATNEPDRIQDGHRDASAV